MSEAEDQHEQREGQGGHESGRDIHDLVLDLNFVPTWARQPAEKNPYADQNYVPPREDRRDRGPRPAGDRDRGPRRDKGGPGRSPRDRRDRQERDAGPGRGPVPQRSTGPDREHRYEPRAPRLPIEVSFIPERNRLGAVVRQLHHSQRAYPLMFVAGLFLSQAEHHMLKLEAHGSQGQAPLRLYQCGACQALFLDAESLQAHAVARHMGDLYDIEEIQVDPPAGNFICVARCRLSGELLGPPNYHGYNERLQEMRRDRFPNLTIDEYRNQIEQVHDQALIEKWKDSQRSQRAYKVKSDPAAAPLKKPEAEAQFLEQHFPKLVHAGQRFVVPATIVKKLEDARLSRVIHDAWVRENRFPLRLSLALRPAFRRMRLHLFKAGRETFVTAIHPRAIDARHTVDEIKQIVQLLHDHPGITRQQLLDKLQPGAAPESPEAIKALNPLRWLIEKGHVIEFFNGTLSVPGGARRGGAGQPVPEEKPHDGPVHAA
jgi:hypothetical protein